MGRGMKVSIVTISYNQARFLEETIRSVIEQDYPEIEYIVVDPGSTDGSREIIERYRDRIDHIIFEPDEGPADGLNKGFAKATGEIFGFLNADDLLLPGAVRRVVDYFRRYPEIDVVSGHGYKIDSAGNIIGKTYSHRFRPRDYVFGACVLVQQSTFFRNSAFRQAGGFNKGNRVSWDGELWFDMGMAGCKFGRMHTFLSAFRMHPDSITVSGRLSHLEKGIKEKMAKRLNIDVSAIESRRIQLIHRFLNRASDPAGTFLRLIGGYL
ncbi:MAG: glycosyltransferase [Nitrospirae bacterium]|nr:MAG: glycosyltransferase [Nitrospirota bacterium]